ncbi:hypothetical protein FHS08_003118 [Microbacterium ulmi]|nr:hypothetical protein [Microbacterium ulmi]
MMLYISLEIVPAGMSRGIAPVTPSFDATGRRAG